MEAINQKPQMFYPWVEPKGIMNLQSLSSGWIDIDSNYISSCNLKSSLLESNEASVFKSTSERQEVSKLVLEHVLKSLPVGTTSCKGNIILNNLNGKSYNIDQTHPLKIASMLVQSDLCIITKIEDDFILTDASVCFPDRWRLDEKIGKSLAEIHKPVKHFEKIRHASNAFLKGMTEPKYRFNYTFSPSDELHLPNEIDGENKFARVERQCFFRLNYESILFTIRTYIQPINEMTDDVLIALLEVLEGRELRTSLGNAKGKYDDVRKRCIERIQMKSSNRWCSIS